MATAKQKLIIVESPAKAKTIGRYLGKGYKVEASQGHVCDLPKSQLGVDPDHDFDLKYITIRGRGDILSRIRKEAKNASQIYFATDPDREGEAISWHLYHVLGVDENKACRIEFNEVTKKAVQAAIKHPRQLDMGRIDAQQARRALDRLVGYKISPLLWAKVKKGLSVKMRSTLSFPRNTGIFPQNAPSAPERKTSCSPHALRPWTGAKSRSTMRNRLPKSES